MAKLSEPEIRERLKKLDGWKYEENTTVKTYEFKTFMAGIKFVNDIARIAVELDHYPDIYIRYNRVKLSVQTPEEGGVTSRDFKLVEEIEGFLHLNPLKLR